MQLQHLAGSLQQPTGRDRVFVLNVQESVVVSLEQLSSELLSPAANHNINNANKTSCVLHPFYYLPQRGRVPAHLPVEGIVSARLCEPHARSQRVEAAAAVPRHLSPQPLNALLPEHQLPPELAALCAYVAHEKRCVVACEVCARQQLSAAEAPQPRSRVQVEHSRDAMCAHCGLQRDQNQRDLSHCSRCCNAKDTVIAAADVCQQEPQLKVW